MKYFLLRKRMADLEIQTYNVQGLGGIGKRTDIFNCLRNLNSDIYCLQETHFTDTKKTINKKYIEW